MTTRRISNENDPKQPPNKKRNSSSLNIKYDQKYNRAWEIDDNYKNWLCHSDKGEYFAYCGACNSHISIKSGKLQLDRHASTEKHSNRVRSLLTQPTLRSLPSVNNTSQLMKNAKDGEIRIAGYIAEHDASFASVDHLPSLMKAVCHDSEIAKKITSGRTKVRAVVTNVLGKEAESCLVAKMRENFFSLIIDESTDVSCKQNLVVLVRMVADNYNGIKDHFFALIPVSDATANGLFTIITKKMNEYRIPWKSKMIGFGSDGANTMMGKNQSVSTLFSKEIPHLFLMKCICHSFALCASNACLKLPRTPEDLARNIYNYLSTSPKRQNLLREFQDFLDLKPHKVLHPSVVHWLSLEQVVIRLNQQWPALRLFFIDAVTHDRLTMAEHILNDMANPLNKMFLEFLEMVLPLFNNLNKLMQSEDSQIQNLFDVVQAVLYTFFDFYLKPETFRGRELKTVELKNPRNFRPLEEMYFGAKAAAFVSDNPTADVQMLKFFRQRCLDFYVEAVQQIINRIPLDNNIIRNLKFLKPENVQSTPTLAPTATQFPNIITPNKLQSLDTEWRLLRNLELDFTNSDVIVFWKEVANLKKGDHTPMFPLLSKFVFAMLSLPHSSAAAERIFSAVNNIKTKKRNRLLPETVSGCLHAKRLIGNDSCFNFPISDQLRSRLNNTIYGS